MLVPEVIGLGSARTGWLARFPFSLHLLLLPQKQECVSSPVSLWSRKPMQQLASGDFLIPPVSSLAICRQNPLQFHCQSLGVYYDIGPSVCILYSTGSPPPQGLLSVAMLKHTEGEKIVTTPMQSVSLLDGGRYSWGCCCAVFGPLASTSLEKQLQMQSD